MIPHFSNPHSLLASTKAVSRAEVFGTDEDIGVANLEDDGLVLVDKLMELIRHSFVSNVGEADSRSKKRRKVDVGSEFDAGIHDSVLFRLVSSSLSPIPLILVPKSPPPPITCEPECEDTDADAQERVKRAQSVAVDFAWILQECHKIYPSFQNANKKLLQVKGPLPTPTPLVMTIQHPKPPRSAGPSESLSNPARISTTPPLLVDMATGMSVRPLVGVVISPVETSSGRRKRKRKKARTLREERSNPMFWTPDPTWGGKAGGYALGYPSNRATYKGNDPCRNSSVRYRRDTMRTCIHVGVMESRGGR